MPRDAFAGARRLSSGQTEPVIGVEATDEDGETDHDGEGILRATHWYSFTASNGVPVTVAFEDFPVSCRVWRYPFTAVRPSQISNWPQGDSNKLTTTAFAPCSASACQP